ncbi:MAG: hypothetical protein WBG02_02340 [Candidatus Acidiferrum sp.]
MKQNDEQRIEELDSTARFYVIFSELANAEEQQDVTAEFSNEIDEIEQVMRMVVDVNEEPPQFVTST